jgi:hypothetical protein
MAFGGASGGGSSSSSTAAFDQVHVVTTAGTGTTAGDVLRAARYLDSSGNWQVKWWNETTKSALGTAPTDTDIRAVGSFIDTPVSKQVVLAVGPIQSVAGTVFFSFYVKAGSAATLSINGGTAVALSPGDSQTFDERSKVFMGRAANYYTITTTATDTVLYDYVVRT